MPNFSGNWKIIRSENFEELLKALGKEVFEGWEGARRALESLEPREPKAIKKRRPNQGVGAWESASQKRGVPDSLGPGASGPGLLNPTF